MCVRLTLSNFSRVKAAHHLSNSAHIDNSSSLHTPRDIPHHSNRIKKDCLCLWLCIFSTDQSIQNFISLSLLLLHASQEQSIAFAKLMKVEAFMPMEMGSMGNVPSVIIWLHLRPLLAECRIGCRSSGTSTWLRSTV